MTLNQQTNRKKVNFPSLCSMSKIVTKLALRWRGSFLKNTTTQRDRAGDVVVLVVDLKRAASEVLYLRWFLCGDLISAGAAEIVMVGECWRSAVMFFCMVRACKKLSRVNTTPKLVIVGFEMFYDTFFWCLNTDNSIFWGMWTKFTTRRQIAPRNCDSMSISANHHHGESMGGNGRFTKK